MTIIYTIDHYVTGTPPDTVVEGNNDLCIWYHDSNPATDLPDTRIAPSSKGFERKVTKGAGGENKHPKKLFIKAIKQDVLSTQNKNKPVTTWGMTVVLEALANDIKKLAPEDTSLY